MTVPQPFLPVQFALASAVDRARVSPDLVGVSSGLTLQGLRWGYLHGAFPMGIGDAAGAPWGWWSPNPRGILRTSELRVRRSLRQSAKKLRLTCNTDFAGVLDGCADPHRDGRWITAEYREFYEQMRGQGEVHSIEVWEGTSLVGGLICVSIGWIVAGESMFHWRRDASKVALWGLCALLDSHQDAPTPLIDVQWKTDHLASLGAQEMSGVAYQAELRHRRGLPGGWSWPEDTDITPLIWDNAQAMTLLAPPMKP